MKPSFIIPQLTFILPRLPKNVFFLPGKVAYNFPSFQTIYIYFLQLFHKSYLLMVLEQLVRDIIVSMLLSSVCKLGGLRMIKNNNDRLLLIQNYLCLLTRCIFSIILFQFHFVTKQIENIPLDLF